MISILSEKTQTKLGQIAEDFERHTIEAVAEDLCQKRVSKPLGDESMGYAVYLDENGPYHIEGIIDYVDSDEKGETVYAEIYDNDMKEHFVAGVLAKV